MVKIFKVLYHRITVVPQQKPLPDCWVEADTPTHQHPSMHLPCSLHAHDFALCRRWRGGEILSSLCAENNFKVQPMLISGLCSLTWTN